MVTNVTSLGRSGLYDWLIQRISAVILGVYFLVIMGYFITSGESVTFAAWSSYMTSLPMKIFTVLAVFSLAAHAWIGMWTAATDYLKPTGIRILFQAFCGIATFVYVVWALLILWGA